MKKITLLLASLFITATASAQLPDGSIAPDFTATDLNGNVHTLSEYLAAGKTVIMDISATWCGPCWSYHGSNALNDFYSSYGQGGSEEVVVLFIEGDNATTIADLNGTGTNTQGDWVSTSLYPIINSGAIAQQYAITYFPTVYRICPTGVITNIGAKSATQLKSLVNSGCSVTLQGIDNNAISTPIENGICSATGAINAKIKNYGGNAITAATVELKENGTVVSTANYAGQINTFQEKEVTFANYTFDLANTYTTTITSVNGAPMINPDVATQNSNIVIAKGSYSNATIKVYTDNYPTEISWNIRNSANTIIAQGGPYTNADKNTTKIHEVTLAPNDCYSIELKDTYGDGWNAGPTQHGLEVFNGDYTVLFIDGEFGAKSLKKANALATTALGLTDSAIEKVRLYPNPTTGIVQISTAETVKVTVVDMLGKVVYENASVDAQTQINLSSFQKGIYMAKIVGENTTQTEKIILN